MTLIWMHSNSLLFWAAPRVTLMFLLSSELWRVERICHLLYRRHHRNLSHLCHDHRTVSTAGEMATSQPPSTWSHDDVWLCSFHSTPVQVVGIYLLGFYLWRCEDCHSVIQWFPLLPMASYLSIWKIMPPMPLSQVLPSCCWCPQPAGLQTCLWLSSQRNAPKCAWNNLLRPGQVLVQIKKHMSFLPIWFCFTFIFFSCGQTKRDFKMHTCG